MLKTGGTNREENWIGDWGANVTTLTADYNAFTYMTASYAAASSTFWRFILVLKARTWPDSMERVVEAVAPPHSFLIFHHH